jgi:aminoglycoside phosphotransferase (APT) family kinase protein
VVEHDLFHQPELIPVRPGEAFDVAKVEAYLKERLPDLEGPMETLQFPGGHANLTYLARFGERELVLRRPPLGPVAPKSHDMAREYRVLSKLADHFPPAPRAYLLCEDPSIMGATFLVMERRRGIVVRFAVPPEIDRHPDARRRMSLALVDAMADLHEIDFRKIGLGDLGKPEGFVERQVVGWKGRWERAKDQDLPLFDRVHEWLVANMPRSSGAGLVHNDLKLDNAMIDPENPGHVVAILDWDMTTLGDPLMDLGTLLCYWAQADDGDAREATKGVTAQPGFPTRAEITERYAQRLGIAVGAVSWYEAFGLWKTAVVLQQIYIRFLRGQTDDQRFGYLGEPVRKLVEVAAGIAGVR